MVGKIPEIYFVHLRHVLSKVPDTDCTYLLFPCMLVFLLSIGSFCLWLNHSDSEAFILGSPQLRHAKAHIIQELSGIEESEDVTGRAFPGIPNVGEGEGGNPECTS